MAVERPTITPPFDPQAYARESESKVRASIPIHASPDDDSGIQPVGMRRVDLGLDEPLSELPPTRPTPVVMLAVPTLAMSRAELARLTLDHRAGFILSHVDGVSDVETILDVSAMPNDEALGILGELVARRIITLR